MCKRNLTLCKKCIDFKREVLKNPEGIKDEKFILYHCDKGSEDEKLLGIDKVRMWSEEDIPENCTMGLEYVMFTEKQE